MAQVRLSSWTRRDRNGNVLIIIRIARRTSKIIGSDPRTPLLCDSVNIAANSTKPRCLLCERSYPDPLRLLKPWKQHYESQQAPLWRFRSSVMKVRNCTSELKSGARSSLRLRVLLKWFLYAGPGFRFCAERVASELHLQLLPLPLPHLPRSLPSRSKSPRRKHVSASLYHSIARANRSNSNWLPCN